MTPGTTSTPRRRTGLLVGVGIVVVLLLGGAYAATRDQPADPPPPVTSPDPTEPALPAGAYAVEAGGGGADVAVDGQTPIGYADDCTGAAHAATNYYVAVLEGLYQDRLTPEEFDDLLDQISAGLDASVHTGPIRDLKTQFRTIREEAQEFGIDFDDPGYHPEWGAFRVHSCAARASATVEIVGFAQDSSGGGVNYSYRAPKVVRVSWFEDDWRLLSLEEMAENPAAGVIPVDSPAPLPREDRHALIAAGGAGWTEYTNAP